MGALLRVAVIRDNRMTFDKLFAPTESVSIGSSSECTVVLRGLVPDSHPLFERRISGYFLNLLEVMAVTIKRDGRVLPRAELNAQNLLVPRRFGRALGACLLLKETDKGSISIGQTKIIFEFAAPVVSGTPNRGALARLTSLFGKKTPDAG